MKYLLDLGSGTVRQMTEGMQLLVEIIGGLLAFPAIIGIQHKIMNCLARETQKSLGLKICGHKPLFASPPDFVGTWEYASDSLNNVLMIPEPSALSLFAIGLGGVVMMRRRRS